MLTFSCALTRLWTCRTSAMVVGVWVCEQWGRRTRGERELGAVRRCLGLHWVVVCLPALRLMSRLYYFSCQGPDLIPRICLSGTFQKPDFVTGAWRLYIPKEHQGHCSVERNNWKVAVIEELFGILINKWKYFQVCPLYSWRSLDCDVIPSRWSNTERVQTSSLNVRNLCEERKLY